MKLFLIVGVCLLVGVNSKAQKIKALTVGDIVPDNLPLSQILNYSKPSATLSEFNKGKLLILDFWATWCVPCVASFPKLDSLQKKFQGKLQILSVTSEKQNTVEVFFNKQKQIKGLSPVSVIEDRLLKRIFPNRLLPHYVWINDQGKVIAITRGGDVNEENIKKYFAGNLTSLPVKIDSFNVIDRTRPFFLITPQVAIPPDKIIYRTDNPTYQSILALKLPEVSGGGRFRTHSLTVENNSLKNLISYIWSEGNSDFIFGNRTLLFVKDTALFTSKNTDDYNLEWGEKNIYNYEIVLSDTTLDKIAKYTLAKEDLFPYFISRGIEVQRKEMPVKVLALIRTTSDDKLKAKGTSKQFEQNAYYFKLINGTIKELGFLLQKTWQTKYPFQDETNYAGKIDIEINADMTSIEAVNKELVKYGLKVIEKEKSLEMIVITQK